MQKNVGSQKLVVYVWDSTTGLPKTGDAANLTAYVSIDWGTVTVLGDTSATEMDATNAKGYYLFDLTQAETNGNVLTFTCKSSTANMVCRATPDVVQTVPSSFVVAPGSSGALLVGGSNAATTFSGLTTGAISATTITASGAVAFQSTFAVTTSTSLGAISGSTLTLSGAVAFQSTVAISGTTTFTGAITASNASNNIVGVALTSAGNAAVATSVLTTAMTESYAADGAAPTLAQAQFMLWSFWSEVGISGVTKTTKKLDGGTAMTFTLDSATQPTSITRAS